MRPVETLLAAAVRALGRARPEWTEAVLAEAMAVPAGRERRAWLLGAVWMALRQPSGGRYARPLVLAGIVATGALTLTVIMRYPYVASGAGTVIYTTLLVVALAGYLLFALRISVPGGTLAGVLAGALLTLGMPAGSGYRLTPSGLELGYRVALVLAVLALPALAAARTARRTGRYEDGLLAGMWSGMVAALVNLVAGLALVLLLPSRVPMDSDVLRRAHTAADILAGNVGEQLVVYIGLLVVWPVFAGALGTAGSALGVLRPSR
jgi:hypothetical protein